MTTRCYKAKHLQDGQTNEQNHERTQQQAGQQTNKQAQKQANNHIMSCHFYFTVIQGMECFYR